MSTLLNLTNKLDSETVATLSDVSDVVTQLNTPYIIVGATARDLILHHGYGAAVQRATSDIDFSVQLELRNPPDRTQVCIHNIRPFQVLPSPT